MLFSIMDAPLASSCRSKIDISGTEKPNHSSHDVFTRGGWNDPNCARRTSTALLCAFREQRDRPSHPISYGCATRQLWPVPRSTFKGTDNPNFFPTASISVFTSCFASSNSFSGTSKINSSWTCRIIFVCGIS